MKIKDIEEDFNIIRPWLTLDKWQYEYIHTDGDCFLLCGRQVGKSTAMSIKAGFLAAENSNYTILVIALTERQAYSLFSKTLNYLYDEYPHLISKGKDKPTKHEIKLRNGSKIMCYPTGLNGDGIRCYTADKILADESSRMSDEVFVSVSPMLSITNGSKDLASTPCGKQGYFYKASLDNNYTKFYVSAEDCKRHSKEHMEKEKERMSEKQYAQEYLAVFLDELSRVFTDAWIKKICVLKRPEFIDKKYKHYLGMDIARMGEDDGSFEIIKKINKDDLRQVENIITRKKLTTETEDRTIELDKIYDFKEIDLDAGSGTLGVSILDHLLNISQTKKKVVAINNRSRSLDKNDQSKSKLLKEDLYMETVSLGEHDKLKLLDDDDVIESLKSVQYEYIIKDGEPTKLRIFGNYTHVAEGIIRAVWAADKDKSLNIWCAYN